MNERTSPDTTIPPTGGESELSVLIAWTGAIDAADDVRLIAAARVHPLFEAAHADLVIQDEHNAAAAIQDSRAYERGRLHDLAKIVAANRERDVVSFVLRGWSDHSLLIAARRAHVSRAVARIMASWPDPYAARELLRLPADYLDGVAL